MSEHVRRLFLRTSLRLAKLLPRGDYRLVRFLAARYPELWEYPIPLKEVSGASMVADLRESIFFSLWKRGCYPHQVPEDRLAKEFLRPGDHVWDVGANVGYTATLYRSLVGEAGQVLAIEPSPRAFNYLARNTAQWSNVIALQVAAGDRTGDCDFLEHHFLDMSSISPPGLDTANTIRVPIDTLDNLFQRYRPRSLDFLKIDVEGFEESVLRGARELLSYYKPLIQFEVLVNDRLEPICKLLEEVKGEYGVFRVAHPGRLIPADSVSGMGMTPNYVAMTHAHRSRFRQGTIC